MKLTAIGDIHGRSIWKKIVSKNDFDKVVLIGDYFDSFTIDPKKQIANFKEIIRFKKKYPQKVVLLLGNHDYHYLNSTTDRYSGFVDSMKKEVSKLLHKAIDEGLIQICFVYDKFLFSHAGITKTWFKKNIFYKKNLEEAINEKFIKHPDAFRFTAGKKHDRFGNEACQTPIWVRPPSLRKDKLDDLIHVVGHTELCNLEISEGVILIDCLGTSGEYLQIKDGKVSINKLSDI